MPKFIIERDIPWIGGFPAETCREIAQRSCDVLKDLGPEIQWVESYVTGDRMYCIYIAPDADMIREHARLGGFPADRISQVARTMDPTTAEGAPVAAGVH